MSWRRARQGEVLVMVEVSPSTRRRRIGSARRWSGGFISLWGMRGIAC